MGRLIDLRLIDLTGSVYGRLTVLQRAGRNKHSKLCRCSCGKKAVVLSRHLRIGKTRSCGCLRREVSVQKGKRLHLFLVPGNPKKLKHGHARRNHYTPEYYAWRDMRRRCYDPHRPKYKYYGGRGITVCDRWRNSFAAFLKDMGIKPEPKRLYSIDRINNDGNYEPGNCRWTTFREQNRNRRSLRKAA